MNDDTTIRAKIFMYEVGKKTEMNLNLSLSKVGLIGMRICVTRLRNDWNHARW